MIALAVGLLVAAAFAFAYSIGAHYTGACMGMPYAAGAIRARNALLVMAPLTVAGAVLASEGVEQTVGHGLLGAGNVSLGLALAIVTSALVLTSAFNFLTIPTSTIQILVFSTVGAGLADGAAVHWTTVDGLLVLWAVAPVAAFALGFLFVRASDRLRPRAATPGPLVRSAVLGLVSVGAAASFAMGANDVANASGALVMTGLFTLPIAALVGGIGLALGVLTWGRPLLERVAYGVVALDPRMAIGAQLAQSSVILVAVAFGAFTSMNQALVGAMIGTGFARGRSTVPWKSIRDILAGWAVGPISGAAVGFALTAGLRSVGAI
ncbi:MAG: inorganic phosphate transporter family protein [Thermoplasmata archaeon]|nr:inorganic phosphate transporter family protein [Thermoplasmata archaeon]MCI4356102.1 inorganic phosphate transporter family protein [Thermoplasmata archaeon]